MGTLTRRSFVVQALAAATASAQSQLWSEDKANEWYSRQPWLVGSNYLPIYAVNQLEMWQKETFDADRASFEMGWAENIGMNTMRVFLHDLLWKMDASGFKRNIDKFLAAARKHKIRPMFVLFDSCWDPFPEAGIQRPPRPGIHNSRWVQSPGASAMQDPKQRGRLLEYLANVVLAFADDDRILAWDVWNEPDNTNDNSYGKGEPANKKAMVLELLPEVFRYVRSGRPTQPLTSGVWRGDWSSPDKLSPIEKVQIEQSDIISFHNYGNAADFEKRVKWLQQYKRPILCTEYMARPMGSTVQSILPIARQYNVAAYNWGFAAGKSQTSLPWDSWQKPYTDRQPEVWFHDLFTANGKPYRQDEVDFIREITASAARAKSGKK